MLVCILYRDLGGGKEKGDTCNATACLRFEDLGNLDDAG